MSSNSSTNVKVMAHPLARANVDRGVRVENTWEHVNREASGCCHARLVRH
jgi:hypothetical protein